MGDEFPEQTEDQTDPMREPMSLWFWRGVRGLGSVPAMVLAASFVGYGALARETGLDLGHTVFAAGIMFALPNQIVLIGAIGAGAGLFAAALAVALSAVRLLPMTMSLMPLLRGPSATKPWLLTVSHVMAVTSWVEAMRNLPALPRPARIYWFSGFAAGIVLLNVPMAAVGWLLAASVRPEFAAALGFLTPVYFLLSLTAASRFAADKWAMAFGLALAPVFHAITPETDLLWTGIVGGILAYGMHRLRLGRSI